MSPIENRLEITNFISVAILNKKCLKGDKNPVPRLASTAAGIPEQGRIIMTYNVSYGSFDFAFVGSWLQSE